MTTEKSKTKCVSFRTSTELINEIISLSESKNILKSHFIQNLINDYFKTKPTIFNYYEVIDDSKKVNTLSFRLPNNIFDKINGICVNLDITKSEFLNYLEAKHKDVLVALKAGKYTDEITDTLTKVAREIADKY